MLDYGNILQLVLYSSAEIYEYWSIGPNHHSGNTSEYGNNP